MSRRSNNIGAYDGYVDHPRYGREPRFTGLNPQQNARGVALHWHNSPKCRVPDTAIAADPARQTASYYKVSHYYDVKRQCRDCKRMFIFFAEEQRYWYEELKFPLDSDCVRCVECRHSERQLANQRQRYESLLPRTDRSEEETLELIECAVTLIEHSIFGPRTIQRVRTLLNSIPKESKLRSRAKFQNLKARADKLKQADD